MSISITIITYNILQNRHCYRYIIHYILYLVIIIITVIVIINIVHNYINNNDDVMYTFNKYCNYITFSSPNINYI
jgi:hypothetical protein